MRATGNVNVVHKQARRARSPEPPQPVKPAVNCLSCGKVFDFRSPNPEARALLAGNGSCTFCGGGVRLELSDGTVFAARPAEPRAALVGLERLGNRRALGGKGGGTTTPASAEGAGIPSELLDFPPTEELEDAGPSISVPLPAWGGAAGSPSAGGTAEPAPGGEASLPRVSPRGTGKGGADHLDMGRLLLQEKPRRPPLGPYTFVAAPRTA